MKTLLTKRRAKLDMNQEQMAALLGTVQSEVSKVEAGKLPTDLKRWAKAYRTTVKKFKAECETAIWPLPLWSLFVETPWDIEGIDCRERVHVNLGANPAAVAVLELEAQGRHVEALQIMALESEMEAIA